MIINFRYHIFTITAIFVALGLGILIGSSIVGPEGLIEEQRKLISNIAHDINKLRDENLDLVKDLDQLRLQMDYRNMLEKELFPLFLKEEFQNKKYYLLNNKEIDKTVKQTLTHFFETLGSTLKIVNNLQEIDKDKLSKILLWDINNQQKASLKELQTIFKEKQIIVYKNDDLIGLIKTLVESELND